MSPLRWLPSWDHDELTRVRHRPMIAARSAADSAMGPRRHCTTSLSLRRALLVYEHPLRACAGPRATAADRSICCCAKHGRTGNASARRSHTYLDLTCRRWVRAAAPSSGRGAVPGRLTAAATPVSARASGFVLAGLAQTMHTHSGQPCQPLIATTGSALTRVHQFVGDAAWSPGRDAYRRTGQATSPGTLARRPLVLQDL